MREAQSRLIGYVQLRVGAKTFAVPVQSVHRGAGATEFPRGFQVEGDNLGIYVDDEAPQAEVEKQIARASDEAARHIGKKYLN